jgi:hypothetical protein
MVISVLILLIMRNITDKKCRKNQNTLLCPITFFWNSCHLWDNEENMVEPDRSQMTISHMRFPRWILKSTYSHPEHVITIAFASILRYTYIPCRAKTHSMTFQFQITHIFCRWKVYISLNAFPDVSPLSQFPKADNVFEIMIWHSSLSCISLAWLDRISPYQISASFAYLLTASP